MPSHFPDFARFSQLASGVQRVPVGRRLLADTLTPVTAFGRLDTGRFAALFESVVGGEKIGRYSFLAADPEVELEAFDHRVRILRGGEVEEREVDDPLAELEALCRLRVARLPEAPPFCGGAIGYAGYDTVRYVERLPDAPPDDRRLPDLAFALFDRMVVFDQVTKTLSVLALADVTQGDLRAAYDEACLRVDQLVDRLLAPTDEVRAADIVNEGHGRRDFRMNMSQAEYEAAVRKAVEYIRAGDIFQVVLSHRLELETPAPPLEIYRSLRVINPSPFMFYLRTPRTTLVGSSPELMVRVVDGMATVRPLAGTRRRGATDEEDRVLAADLLADPKERAEHVMLVDLGRNDVGRVAQYGTVQLSDVMSIERYSHVMHLSSNVCGRLREGLTAFDALRACLPAGTVSGAPKVRAMQIIDELERNRRGPYAGAVGYIDFNGNMDTCIALRTLVVAGGKAFVQVGAGIVADSDPSSEWQETMNKAGVLLRAIEVTEQRLKGG